MAGQHSKVIKPIYFIGDMLIINLAFLLSFYLQFYDFENYFNYPFVVLQIIVIASWIVVITSMKAYKLYRVQTMLAIAWNVLRHIIVYWVIVEILSEILINVQHSRILLFYFFGITSIAIIAWRISSTIFLRILRKRGHNYRRVVIAGVNDSTRDIIDFFNIHPEHGYRLLKTFDLKEYNNDIEKYISEMKLFCFENMIDEIYCSMSEFNSEQLNCLIELSEKDVLRLKFILNPLGLNFRDFKIDFYGYLPVYIFRSIPLDDNVNKIIKRLFDLFFSFFVFIFIFSWLFPVIAIVIKLNSSGPIFFKQKRSGLDDYDFGCYKFRTMHFIDKEDAIQATKGDSRVTSVGAFLRKTSLDELPQFLNVVLGEMSVVGPRPHPLWLNEKYRNTVEKYMVRHFIKPGITGLAQVKGYRGETITPAMMERRIKMDLFYMENWSFLLDIKIILLTIWNIIAGDEKAV